MFLSTWFAHCSLAVESFLKINNGIPYFITQVCIYTDLVINLEAKKCKNKLYFNYLSTFIE